MHGYLVKCLISRHYILCESKSLKNVKMSFRHDRKQIKNVQENMQKIGEKRLTKSRKLHNIKSRV